MFSTTINKVSNLVGLSSTPLRERRHLAAPRTPGDSKGLEDRSPHERKEERQSTRDRDDGGRRQLPVAPRAAAGDEEPVRKRNKDMAQSRVDSHAEPTALRGEGLQQQDKMRAMEATIRRLEAELQLARTEAVNNDEFKVTANLASTRDVVRKMQNLNSEFYHIATVLADSEAYPRPTANNSAEVFAEWKEYLSDLVGSELAQYLFHAKPCDVPDTVVQMMLQAAMARWCTPILESWVCGAKERDIDRMLGNLYGTLRANEDPTDASRWRVMTRKNAQSIFAPKIKDLRGELLWNVTTVLTLTNARIDGQAVDRSVGKGVDAVVDSVLDLNRVIGTQMVSDDLYITSMRSGDTFDPETMENMWEDNKKQRTPGNDVVVLTSGLGIAKKVPRSSDHIILLRPNVLLRSDLDEILP
ncbi:hypothetical protein C8F01DRAFT_1362301 [Mycena amicta]|nr:hypothetical protein C8F01DRAFT_1362301 [Mycena amicta]